MPSRELLEAQINGCNWQLQVLAAARWAYEPEDYKSEVLHLQDRRNDFRAQLKELLQ